MDIERLERDEILAVPVYQIIDNDRESPDNS
jgi:hypothetical protein